MLNTSYSGYTTSVYFLPDVLNLMSLSTVVISSYINISSVLLEDRPGEGND